MDLGPPIYEANSLGAGLARSRHQPRPVQVLDVSEEDDGDDDNEADEHNDELVALPRDIGRPSPARGPPGRGMSAASLQGWRAASSATVQKPILLSQAMRPKKGKGVPTSGLGTAPKGQRSGSATDNVDVRFGKKEAVSPPGYERFPADGTGLLSPQH